MSTIPTKLTQKQFEDHVSPYLSKAKRGYVSKIPLYKIFNYLLYWLYTGCQWSALPVAFLSPDSEQPEISYHAVYYHHRKWSRDGSLAAVWAHSIRTVLPDLDLTHLNLDGTHTIAKKGGESVRYQGRKKAKTSNILPIVEVKGYIIASTGIVSGQHHDLWQLSSHLQSALAWMRRLGLKIQGSIFNVDTGFDSRAFRKLCWSNGIYPNVKENKRNRKGIKLGRKRWFDVEAHKKRFVVERSFAWLDKFKRLLIRFEQKDSYFLGGHHIAFAMVNLRHVLALG